MRCDLSGGANDGTACFCAKRRLCCQFGMADRSRLHPQHNCCHMVIGRYCMITSGAGSRIPLVFITCL